MRRETDVFEISRNLSLLAWKAARWLYANGASDSIVGRFYSALRLNGNYNKNSLSLWLLGRDVRSSFSDSDEPLIVAHPSLAGILQNRSNLIYQHGELITPSEAVVHGASTVIVPTNGAAMAFTQSGYTTDQIFVSGLCIEPPIARQAEDAFEARVERYSSTAPLTGAFFSSGAEPQAHIDLLVAAAMSVVQQDGNAIVFAKKDGRLATNVKSIQSEAEYPFLSIDASDQIPHTPAGLLLVEYNNRREENALSAKLFPEFDYFVSPAHERSNWAVGLGLPIFILERCYGPFAPLNRNLLLDRGVAEAIPDEEAANCHAERVDSLREEGALLKMAQKGWKVEKIDGFARIAEFLLNKYPVSS